MIVITPKKPGLYQDASEKKNIDLEPPSNHNWRVAIIIIAVMPVFHFVATWDFDGNITIANRVLRLYSLPIVALELAVLFWASRSGWNPAYHYRCLPLLARYNISIWVIWAFGVSIMVSTSPMTSVLFAFRYSLHALLLSALIFLLSSAKHFDFKFWTSKLIIGLHAYLLLLIIFCLAVFDQKDFRWVERVPSATNIRQIGNVVGLLTIVPAAMLLFEPLREKRLLLLASVTTAMAFIMWTGTRGAIVGFVAAICVAGWMLRSAIPVSRFAGLAFSLAVALAISVIIPIPSDEFGIIRIADSFSGSDPSSGRVAMWKSTIEAIKSAPILGHGSGTYRDNMLLLNNYPYNHPHNFVLQFAYDWGVFGGSCALLLLCGLGWAVIKSNRATDEKRFVGVGGIVAVVSVGLIEGTLFHPLPIIIALTLSTPALIHASIAAGPYQFKE
jgi:O-antigen ligase